MSHMGRAPAVAAHQDADIRNRCEGWKTGLGSGHLQR